MEKNRKYRYEGEVTAEALSAFAESILDGTAQATFKSAPIPAEPTEDGVTIVVGKNFDNIVLDSSKDVLLEVYAPWCGHVSTGMGCGHGMWLASCSCPCAGRLQQLASVWAWSTEVVLKRSRGGVCEFGLDICVLCGEGWSWQLSTGGQGMGRVA